MSRFTYTLLGLTALVAALVGVLAFAVMRFLAAAREVRRQARSNGERVFVTAALEEAVGRLKTQERAMTARAEESERLSDQIMASLSSGLIVVGLDNTVRVVNPSAAKLLDLPETAGVVYQETLRCAPPFVELIDECLRTGVSLPRKTVVVAHPQRGMLHFGVGVSALRDGRGSLHGAICLFTDLTDIVALEEQVRIKDSLARLGELTAGLAHEFRNGLATIHGYGRMLDPVKLPEQYRPYVQGIRDETDSLGHIVNNFLAFARPATLMFTPLDLGAIASAAADDVRQEVTARGGQVELRGTFATVKGDETLLRQAMSNLLRNAVEACEQASVAPRIDISGEMDQGACVARVSIADNGIGVSPAARAHLFTPFFTTKKEGTGLGLALVQKIVVSHDGRITVLSPQSGACFQIELPIGEVASSE